MTDREAIKLALEALQNNRYIIESEINPPQALEEVDVAIAALRQALEQTEQKPVAYMGVDIEGNPTKFRLNYFGGAIPLYTKEQS